jgi:hypothetical protein
MTGKKAILNFSILFLSFSGERIPAMSSKIPLEYNIFQVQFPQKLEAKTNLRLYRNYG